MTVAELIEKLKMMPENVMIVCHSPHEEFDPCDVIFDDEIGFAVLALI